VINDKPQMGERRKPIPSTNVFAFDDEGNKFQLSPRDFGARHQERLGSQVRGIAPPPPTQFIEIPIQARLMTADDVLRDMIQERRTISAQATAAWKKLVELLVHTFMLVDRWFFRTRLHMNKYRTKAKEVLRRRRANLDDFWSYDLTEIAESPPTFTPKRRRPSVV
jgi:hypothetical protein